MEVRCKSAESNFALEVAPLLGRLQRRCCEPYSARVSCACSGMPTRGVQSRHARRAAPRRGASRTDDRVVTRQQARRALAVTSAASALGVAAAAATHGHRARTGAGDRTVAPRAAPDSDQQSRRCDF